MPSYRNLNKVVDALIGAPIVGAQRMEIWVGSRKTVQDSADVAEMLGNAEESFSSLDKIKGHLSDEQIKAVETRILKSIGVEEEAKAPVPTPAPASDSKG